MNLTLNKKIISEIKGKVRRELEKAIVNENDPQAMQRLQRKRLKELERELRSTMVFIIDDFRNLI